MRLRLCVAALLLSTACTDAKGSMNALKDAGYTDITTGGYSMFGCGKEDTWATKFTAKGPTGRRVNGVVCAGWFKGKTIRLD